MTNNDDLALTLKAAAEKAKAALTSKAISRDELLKAADGLAIIASPANILSLLAERDADKKRIEMLEKYVNERDAQSQELLLNIGSLQQCIAELREYYEGVIADGSKRIAELEERTVREVREEDNKFLVVRHPGKVPVIKHPTGDIEEFLLQLFKDDPLATIDIVTHRYYGVGGQFVQDADEYLRRRWHQTGCGGVKMQTENGSNLALELRRREQRNFEEWIERDTCLGWKSLDGIRMENGLMDYDDIDIKNKWSGWLAARTGQKSWEAV